MAPYKFPRRLWILCGRRNDIAMRCKAILETSLAFSPTHNPRNIVYFWYSLWYQTLSDLVADILNLVVAPQFPLWYVPTDDDREDENDGNYPREEPMEEEDAQGNRIIEDEDNDGDLEIERDGISFASTIPGKGTHGVLVDFAILNLTAVAQPLQRHHHGGWKITAELRILGRLVEAKNDLIEQAGYLFLRVTSLNSVLVIAAAGPYWSGTTICRGDVNQTMHELSAKDPSYLPSTEQRPDTKLKWNKILRVGVPRSGDRLSTIYNTSKDMGVLEVPADV